MRHLLAPLVLVAFIAAGCVDRERYQTVPDREGRAAGPSSKGVIDRGVMAGENEQWYTAQPNDTYSSVAKKYNVTVKSLMVRNRITSEAELKPGQQLIVPRGK